MKRLFALLVTMLALSTTVAYAEPKAPTEGGNGAGSSVQCTGPRVDRPASCK